jgi:hypothetical protein
MLSKNQSFAVIGTTVIGVVILGLALRYSWGRWRREERRENPRLVVAERKAEVAKQQAQIRASQLATSSKAAFTTIDLKKYVNLALEDERPGPKGATNNNLAALPIGTNIYGGVPFDVEGTIQLMGQLISQLGGEKYPVRVDHIKVGKHCEKIHLLHGATFLSGEANGTQIARLALTYGDGSRQNVGIVAGEHVLDWWGPLYTTGANPQAIKTSAPETELAWTGTNEWIAKKKPKYALRLYKSTFKNPNPKKEIKSLDFVSTMTPAAPFLLGLTVE